MSERTKIIIRAAKTDELIDLRHTILRAGLPRQTAYFEGDDEPTTRHIVAETDGKIVGCATILHRAWNGEPAWQLRGMAVADGLRGAGIGTMLLAENERIVRDKTSHSLQLWCNARTPAAPFYQRHGWSIVSEEFHIEHAGPHVKMTRRLSPLSSSG